MNTKMKASRLSELDALRGLAALSVLLFHFTYNQPGIRPDSQFTAGVASVDLFFMISGFVTCLTIHDKRPKDYLLNRLTRLFPTYWLCLSATSLVMFFAEPVRFSIFDSWVNMSMLQSFFGVEDLDGSYWTLLTEMLFYGWVLGVLYTGNIKRIERAGLLTLSVVLFYHAMRDLYPAAYSLIQHKFSLVNHFPLFLSGVLFHRIRKYGYSLEDLLALLISLGAALYLHNKGGRTMYLMSVGQHAVIIAIFHFLFILLLAGKLRFLIKPWLLFLGRISYSLYLLHQYIGLCMIRFLVSDAAIPVWLAIVVVTTCMIYTAYLVSFYIEMPLLKWLRSAPVYLVEVKPAGQEVKSRVGDLV